MRWIVAALVLALTTAVAASQAAGDGEDDDDECTAPMAVWQPREALQRKLEAEGWKVLRITIDDGCYEVDAVDPTGADVEAEFDPETFRLIEIELEG